MAILHRILVIVLLILSVAALVLGIKLFYQRDELKGRDHALVQNVIGIASNIEAETGQELTTKDLPTMDKKITENQLKTFFRVNPQTGKKEMTGEGTMDAAFKELIGRAQVQLSRLNETRDSLAQTQQTLAETKAAKEKVEGELAAEKKITKEQGEKIAALTEEIKQKTDSIAQLEEAKKALQDQVDDQKAKLAKLQDDKKELEEGKRLDQQRIRQLEKDLAALTQVNPGEAPRTPPGLKGQILLASTNWNFVILGLAKDAQIGPMVELIVNRQDQFVGKIRVSEVHSTFNLAVAEILDDWQKMPIKEGDSVIY